MITYSLYHTFGGLSRGSPNFFYYLFWSGSAYTLLTLLGRGGLGGPHTSPLDAFIIPQIVGFVKRVFQISLKNLLLGNPPFSEWATALLTLFTIPQLCGVVKGVLVFLQKFFEGVPDFINQLVHAVAFSVAYALALLTLIIIAEIW